MMDRERACRFLGCRDVDDETLEVLGRLFPEQKKVEKPPFVKRATKAERTERKRVRAARRKNRKNRR